MKQSRLCASYRVQTMLPVILRATDLGSRFRYFRGMILYSTNRASVGGSKAEALATCSAPTDGTEDRPKCG